MSMAYTSSSLHNPSLGWDCHDHLRVLNTDKISLAMDEYMMNAAPFGSHSPPDQLDFSTGYLEDALVEFSERSKRRRMLLYTDSEINDSTATLLEKRYWNSHREVSENFDCMSQLTTSSGLSVLLGDPVSITTPMTMSRISEGANKVTKINTPEEATISAPEAIDSSSSSSYKDSVNADSDYLPAQKETLFFKIAPASGDTSDQKREKKRVITRVVYPFALVKPGGGEGDITLNDINERILMPPTRPVRHPVGDYACQPWYLLMALAFLGKLLWPLPEFTLRVEALSLLSELKVNRLLMACRLLINMHEFLPSLIDY